MKILRNNRGFSLVELMVVVAIIGILSSIAIPQINRYMAKARQTEAKMNLGSIYTANKAFFAEYNTFDNRFPVIGYRPEGNLRYNIGWDACASTTLSDYGYTTTPLDGCATLTFCAKTASNTATCKTMDGASATPGGGTIAEQTFEASASGRIGTNTVDIWKINNNKRLTNPADGTQ